MLGVGIRDFLSNSRGATGINNVDTEIIANRPLHRYIDNVETNIFIFQFEKSKLRLCTYKTQDCGPFSKITPITPDSPY